LTVPRSLAKQVDEYTRITFGDVYNYIYLDQTEIDRSTIHHLDHSRNVKRQQTFRMLYRLLDAESARLQVEINDAESRRTRLKERIAVVEDFLTTSEHPSRSELEQRRHELDTVMQQLRVSIEQINQDARRVSAELDADRQAIESVTETLTGLRKSLGDTEAQRHGLTKLRAQLVLDHQRTVKALVAGDVLSAFEFRSCPRCLQTLDREVDGVACIVCCKPEPAMVDATSLDEERGRLEAQLAETDGLVEDLAARVVALRQSAERSTTQLAVARAELNQRGADALAPFADERARIFERVGTVREQIAGLQRQAHLLDRVDRQSQEVQNLTTLIGALNSELDEARADEGLARERVGELSDIFAEIIGGLQLPWSASPSVDPNTYLPLIDGARLETLGSGGMKVIVNIAYFVANLTWSLRHPEALLPRLLIIDSPRKDHGAGEEDMAAADRIYEWILRLQRAMASSGTSLRGRPFQFIIADNDLPAFVRDEAHVVALDYDSPLISDASADKLEDEQ
jgi:hypothetical protein